jgi:hypothetical protein
VAPAHLLLALAAAPVSVSTAPLKTVNIEPKLGAFFTEHFTQQLSLQPGLRVISTEDVAAVVGLERQKELLGCPETSSSCLLELAGALGVDVIVTGTIANVGSAYTVNLRVLGAGDARNLGVLSERAAGGDDALLELLGTAARRLAGDVRRAFAAPGTPLEEQWVQAPPPLRGMAWIPAVVAAVALVAGVALLVLANNSATRVSAGDPSIMTVEELDRSIALGRTEAELCVVTMTVAGAAAVTAAVMFMLPGRRVPATQVSAWLAPGAAGLTARWSLP